MLFKIMLMKGGKTFVEKPFSKARAEFILQIQTPIKNKNKINEGIYL